MGASRAMSRCHSEQAMRHVRARVLMLARVRPITSVMGALVLALCMSASPVLSGTICGTVRDALTSVPVPNAGVFIRTPDGLYTGLHGATDASGWFCIGEIPPGTYDVEARVDDYRVAYLHDVEVTGAVDVSISADLTAIVFAPPRPNPARVGTELSWTLAEPAPVRLTVFDACGRPVRAWGGGLQPAGHFKLVWDLRDGAGRDLNPGIYWIRLDVGGARYVRSLIRAR